MCGIAGYSLDPKITEHITSDKLETLVKEAVTRNIHRGKDAAGIFAAVPETEEPMVHFWKLEGDGITNFDKMKAFLGDLPKVPTTMGIHTRAKSAGFSEKDNRNNHPVIYNGVIANHNGMIRNHLLLKAKKDIRPDQIYNNTPPPVDSLVIPMLLDTINDPVEEFDRIAELLSAMDGGWAFHAMWSKFPKLSLLVAGPDYPLTVRYSKGRLVYSSEPDAVSMMMQKIDLPWSHNNKAREMDPGSLMLVSEGEPVLFGQYDLRRKVMNHKLKELGYSEYSTSEGYVRYFESDENKAEIRNKTTRPGLTGQNARMWSSTVIPESDITLLYDSENGVHYSDKTEEYFQKTTPNLSPKKLSDMKDIVDLGLLRSSYENFMEADRIYLGKDMVGKDGVLIYAWYGTTEIVASDYGTIIQIYDWSKGSYKRVKTTAEILEEREKLITSDMNNYSALLHAQSKDFRRWMNENSTDSSNGAIKSNVVGGQFHHGNTVDLVRKQQLKEYENLFKRHNANDDKPDDNDEEMVGWYTGFTSEAETLEVLEAFGFEPPKDIKLPLSTIALILREPLINMEEVDTLYTHSNARIDSIPFVFTCLCPNHKEALIHHANPLECEALMFVSALTIDLFRNIDTYKAYWDEEIAIEIRYGDSPRDYGCLHDWLNETDIGLEIFGVSINICESEKCKKCNATRQITRYPTPIVTIMEWAIEQELGGKQKMLPANTGSYDAWSD